MFMMIPSLVDDKIMPAMLGRCDYSGEVCSVLRLDLMGAIMGSDRIGQVMMKSNQIE